ncbi:MAG: chemotaxis protein CheB [Fibrobacterota bacterium]
MPKPDTPVLYAGIGASAGGLEALEAFFSNMPPESGFSFIVVQHLSPDYKSLMVELLSKKTRMNVYRAEEGMRVKANCVYLIPPKKNLTIFHGKLLLTDQKNDHSLNLPIDIFFKSLADDQFEKAVGIILSGTGSDGTRGIRAIKENGGMVIVQDRESSKFDGMPRAAASTGLSDLILSPPEMPEHLIAFSKHPYVRKADSPDKKEKEDDELTKIFSLLRKRAKIDFTFYKPSTILRRIERRMGINQIHEIKEYVNYLENYPGEVSVLSRELLIGVTNFFRDPGSFKILEKEYIPEILNKSMNREIRLWSAGCSTGEEAYTLAIILKECMETYGISRDIKIFATDIDREAVLKAGSGIYPESIMNDIPPEILSKYFYKTDGSYRIARNIREMVVFAHHNLLKDPPFTNIDLVSCRNLLIYLQPVMQRKVLELFNFSIKNKGLLFLGSSETTGELSNYFENINQKHKIYRSRGKTATGPSGRNIVYSEQRSGDFRPRFSGAKIIQRKSGEEKILESFIKIISEQYFSLALLVNENLEVIQVFGDTDGYLKLPSGRLINDISKMAVKELSIPISTGLQKCFRTNSEIKYSNILFSDRGVSAGMIIIPLSLPKGMEPLAAVIIEENKEKHNSENSQSTLDNYDMSRETEDHIKDLEQELQFSRENLQATIEELETSNEELQATNEELLASNEELQSTNEELQSTNEELHTVNTEYQNKIIELTELQNDVDNMLASSQIIKIFLDENLEIRKFSPNADEIFRILDTDTGRPLSHLHHNLKNTDITGIIREVHEKGQLRETETVTDEGKWFLLRALPYYIAPETISGILITLVDITNIKKSAKELDKNRTELKEMASLAGIGSWTYYPDTGEHTWSEETFRIHELDDMIQPDPEKGINFYIPPHRPVITEAFEKASKEGLPYDLLLQIITAKKNKKWVRAIGNPIKKNGEIFKITGAFQDVTEIIDTNEALRQYEFLFEMTGIIFPVLFCDWNMKTGILNLNNKWADMLRLKSTEIESRAFTEMISGKDRDVFNKTLKNLEPGKCEKIGFEVSLPGGETINFKGLAGKLNKKENGATIHTFLTVKTDG